MICEASALEYSASPLVERFASCVAFRRLAYSTLAPLMFAEAGKPEAAWRSPVMTPGPPALRLTHFQGRLTSKADSLVSVCSSECAS